MDGKVRAHARLGRDVRPATIKALHEVLRTLAKKHFNYEGPIEVTLCHGADPLDLAARPDRYEWQKR
jgi:hypothetical protein